MKRTIITIFLFFLLGNLYAENSFHFKENGMLYDSEDKPILSKKTWTLDEFEKIYPSMRYLDAENFQIGNEAPFNLAAYPWIIWGGANLGFTDFEMEANLIVRWVWLEYPEGNNLQKKEYNYFGGIYQDPPDDISIDILGKLTIIKDLQYSQILRIFEDENMEYEEYPKDESSGRHSDLFVDFGGLIVLRVPTKNKKMAFILLFNKKNKIMAVKNW